MAEDDARKTRGEGAASDMSTEADAEPTGEMQRALEFVDRLPLPADPDASKTTTMPTMTTTVTAATSPMAGTDTGGQHTTPIRLANPAAAATAPFTAPFGDGGGGGDGDGGDGGDGDGGDAACRTQRDHCTVSTTTMEWRWC